MMNATGDDAAQLEALERRPMSDVLSFLERWLRRTLAEQEHAKKLLQESKRKRGKRR